MNNYTETNECQELKNIKYKTMLLSGTTDISVTNLENIPDLSGIENILENERKLNLKETWSKLDKTIKLKKLYEYCELLTKKDKLNSDEKKNLKIYMSKCLDRKQLGRVKDVVYNIEKGIIENIPNLFFNEPNRKYSLKRCDKRVSTLKSLGLGVNKTRKKSEKIDTNIKKSD